MSDPYKQPLSRQQEIIRVWRRRSLVCWQIAGVLTGLGLVIMFCQPLIIASLPRWCFDSHGELLTGPWAALCITAGVYALAIIVSVALAIDACEHADKVGQADAPQKDS